MEKSEPVLLTPEPGRVSGIFMALFRQGEYRAAEQLARAMLDESPRNLGFLQWLDIALNGQGRASEAEMVRLRVLAAWREMQQGIPVDCGFNVAEECWMRVVDRRDGYLLVISEYYHPATTCQDPCRFALCYKCVVTQDQEGKSRLFRLEYSRLIDDYYTLREVFPSGGRQLVVYGETRPSLARIVKDLGIQIDGG